jgi:hypothetical protein
LTRARRNASAARIAIAGLPALPVGPPTDNSPHPDARKTIARVTVALCPPRRIIPKRVFNPTLRGAKSVSDADGIPREKMTPDAR